MKQPCPSCGKKVQRILFSRILEPMMHGRPEGYGKPSASRRHSYKLAAEKGNQNAI